jgi:hypothetical protein
MKKNLRKVTFNLNGANVFGFQKMTIGDYESDAERYFQEREGFFHQWGEMIQQDSEGHPFQITYGLVEDLEGIIHIVPPTNIKFND